MQKQRLWKSLKYRDGKIVSEYDGSEWIIGEWRTVCEPTELCKGLNCSKNILDAMGFVTPDVIAEVEVLGKCIKGDDKYTCERMRILHAWMWEKPDSVAMSIFAARLCLGNFEKAFPKDNRVRLAIEAAETYLKNPTEKNRSAARSAAWSAAESAAWSAESAARESTKQKIHNFIVKHLEAKVEITP